MKLFLSWSGQQSHDVAKAFYDWIPYVINQVTPWMSAEDIQAGSRWGTDVQRELEEASFGIVFVTKSNTEAPWLLFEAGAIAKKLTDVFLCPYLIGMETHELKGPLSQFQMKKCSSEGTFDLVKSINNSVSEDALAGDRLRTAFDLWWPVFEKNIEQIPEDSGSKEAVSDRSTEDMISELLTTVRRLDRNAVASQRDRRIRVPGDIVVKDHVLEVSPGHIVRSSGPHAKGLVVKKIRTLVDDDHSAEYIVKYVTAMGLGHFSDTWIRDVIHIHERDKNESSSEGSGGLSSSASGSSLSGNDLKNDTN